MKLDCGERFSMRNFFKFLIAAFFFITCVGLCKAEEVAVQKDVKDYINELKNIAPTEYLQKIDGIVKVIDENIEEKKLNCDGEFKDGITHKRKRLTRDERNNCIKELKNIRILYANNLFVVRKNYLDYEHQERIKKLVEMRDEVVKQISKGKI